MSDAQNLAKTIRSGKTIWSAGAIDALTAKLIQEAGFDAIFTTGFGVSASHLGQPDMELYTMTENLNVVRNIVSATQTPVISDTDTGYGNALNVMRTVREFERAGVQAMIFEDQESPKRCPAATSQVALVPLEEGAAKIRAAVSARQSDDTLIIARTDTMNEAEAIERAKAYVAAGADLIQPISKCFTDFAGLKRLHQACGRRLSLQILGWLETGLTPNQIEDVAALAVYPLVPLMTITAAVRENLERLIADKSTANLPHPVTSMADFKTFIGFDETEQLQNQFLTSPTLDT